MEKHKVEWFIQKHREMWNWIADQILERKILLDIAEAKLTWCLEIGLAPISGCFACECKYAIHEACSRCEYAYCRKGCLFNWVESSENFVSCIGRKSSLYVRCTNARTYRKQAELARKIANLPVREEVVEFAKSLGM